MARVLGFGVGLALGSILLAGLSQLYRGMWLPVGLGLVLSALLYGSNWVRARGLAGVVSLALGSGVCWGWLATSSASSKRFDAAFLPTALTGIVAVLTSAATLAVIVYLPAKQRPPAWRLLLPVLMAWIVGIASSSAGGAGPMQQWLMEQFHLTRDQAHEVIFIVRKTIHFTFYGCLGLAAWWGAHSAKESLRSKFQFGVLFALSVATFDELRQVTAAGRSASATDVLLDLAGALVFVGIATWKTGKKKGKSAARKSGG